MKFLSILFVFSICSASLVTAQETANESNTRFNTLCERAGGQLFRVCRRAIRTCEDFGVSSPQCDRHKNIVLSLDKSRTSGR